MGKEKRRTRKLNWSKLMRSMYCRGHVDHGSEDARISAQEPAQKESTPYKETSLAA